MIKARLAIAAAVVLGAVTARVKVVGCGGTDSLVSYHPAADTSTVLLGPPVNGGGVTDAILFSDQD